QGLQWPKHVVAGSARPPSIGKSYRALELRVRATQAFPNQLDSLKPLVAESTVQLQQAQSPRHDVDRIPNGVRRRADHSLQDHPRALNVCVTRCGVTRLAST